MVFGATNGLNELLKQSAVNQDLMWVFSIKNPLVR